MQVELIPLNGLIDLNKAPRDLLAALMSRQGRCLLSKLPLAEDTVQYHYWRDTQGVKVGFESVQDPLSVPGVDYNLYARLFALVTADLKAVAESILWQHR